MLRGVSALMLSLLSLETQPSNQSSCLLFLQMTHNLKWTSNPVQMIRCGIRGIPHTAAAITSSWCIPNIRWPHVIWKGVTCGSGPPLVLRQLDQG